MHTRRLFVRLRAIRFANCHHIYNLHRHAHATLNFASQSSAHELFYYIELCVECLLNLEFAYVRGYNEMSTYKKGHNYERIGRT